QVHVLRGPHRGWAQARVRDRLSDRRHHLRRPRRHGGRSQAANRDGPRHVHPPDLRTRRGRRHECPAPVVGAVRADRLHHRAAEGADARPDAPVAARHTALLRPALRGVWCAHLDHAPTLEPRRVQRTPHVNWRIRLTWWDVLLLAITALGVVLAVVRYAGGIGSVANINNAYPWGWWVGFGIMTMIALGGVGFTITLLVEILGRHRYHALLRPAVLMGLLCYASAIVMLMVELGRPWKVWMILVSWAPSAALYEVGWCAFLYLNVLVLEFAQVPLEELGWGRALKILRVIYIPIMLLGVTLSHLHQSSLGTLMTLIPHKINVL